MKTKRFRYNLELDVIDVHTETAIDDLHRKLSAEADRLNDTNYRRKARAISVKWEGLTFLRAEIEAMDAASAAATALPTLVSGMLVSKIEMYLSYSRSILDILAYCLGESLGVGGKDQSFNDFRKKDRLPQWIRDHIAKATAYEGSRSQSKNGWMLNLITDESIHGKSLRDFVMHSGAVTLVGVQQFDGGYKLAFQPRKPGDWLYHIEDMTRLIYDGMNSLFRCITTNMQ